jgi:hypothetical protein
MDAKPVKLDREFATPAELDLPGVTGDAGDEFWTRWDSEEPVTQVPTSSVFTAEDGANFGIKMHKDKIVSLSAGCGRGKNRLGELADGTKFCCRYRELQWREIRGEFYAYHLNNLLGLYNAPPATLLKINYSSPQWSGVADSAREAGWSNHMTIIVTLFVEDLAQETFPPILTGSENGFVTEKYLDSASPEEKSRILQWSDLLVFDFLVGHSDRVFNSLFNLQWNEHMLQRPVHNLLKTKRGKKLLLFDNESGFWMGYKMGRREASKFEMQERFLKKMCVFRDRTLHHVRHLLYGDKTLSQSSSGSVESPSRILERYIKNNDPQSFQMVEPLGNEQKKEFESRLRLLMKQVEKCKEELE